MVVPGFYPERNKKLIKNKSRLGKPCRCPSLVAGPLDPDRVAFLTAPKPPTAEADLYLRYFFFDNI